jgi:FHA domain
VNAIARFEQLCARVVEGTFARIFPSALEPAHVGRKLIAAQAATPTDTFLVRVHPVDYAHFASDRAFLEARWSAMLRENAPSREQPQAVLHEDPEIVAGSVTIEALVDDRPTVISLVRPDGEALALFDGMRIGRNDDNDVVVVDGRVSRHHARIVTDGSGFAVEDLQSSNGTFVDGTAIERARIKPGSSIVVGETVLEVRG